MPRPLRSELFLPHEVSICHVVQRCVRRMFLAGVNDETGKDYTYRREWIRQRLEKLASVFAIGTNRDKQCHPLYERGEAGRMRVRRFSNA